MILQYDQKKIGDVILEIQDLKVDFHTYAGGVKALDGIDLQIYKGEILGIVGESGAGKSVTALAIAGLLPENAKIVGGRIMLYGEDLTTKSLEEMQKIRAKKIAMIFQDPMTFLNPVLTIGDQLTEVFLLNKDDLIIEAEQLSYIDKMRDDKKLSNRELKNIALRLSVEALRRLDISDPGRIVKQYPHELSGGMRQRVMIAMAVARKPDILIADEITTALDVTIQAQILELLKQLKREIDASIIIITHDLGVVAEVADRIAVMYAGNIVEIAPIKELFKNPIHPYTKGLLKAVPIIGSSGTRLESIPGSIPDLINPPPGCRFHPRCPFASENCGKEKPKLQKAWSDHYVSCCTI